MIVLGLAGAAGTGKDTVADYLVKRYGFVKFAFSDALYREVAAAFDLPHDSILRNRDTKEVGTDHLALDLCGDREFVAIAEAQLAKLSVEAPDCYPCSPRQILQWWGTEYRRAQDPLYWIKATRSWMEQVWGACPYPEHRPQLFVNTTVRFENEREFIHSFSCGNIWHLRREAAVPVAAHVSEQVLPVLEGERELYNNDTIDRLHCGVELLLSTAAPRVRCEPMLPYEEPKAE
jgi:hypothetical protein